MRHGHELLGGQLEEHRVRAAQCHAIGEFILDSGVLVAEGAEGPARHVRGELDIAEFQDRAPELEDAPD